MNLAFDFYAYHKMNASDDAARLVTQTHDVTLHLQKLENAVTLFILDPNNRQKLDRVRHEMAFVSKYELDPYMTELLDSLSTALLSNVDLAPRILSKLMTFENRLLQERLQKDFRENREVQRSLLNALFFDVFIFIVLFLFFWGELKSRLSIEKTLKTSLNFLRQANLSLREEQLKRQMSLKTAVHDLKNPLGTIRGFAELISDEVGSTPSVQSFSEAIKKVSQNSLNLVDSLLSQPEAAHSKDTQDLISILNEICLQTEVNARKKNQIFVKHFSLNRAPVLGHRHKLEDLIANILSNAVKYSPPHSTVWIRCFLKQERYRVEIEDQGPGFSQEDQDKAFRYGQTLSARPTGDESSTGFGLFIARQIVETHHGEIHIMDPQKGRGACVYFEIPAVKEAATDLKFV